MKKLIFILFLLPTLAYSQVVAKQTDIVAPIVSSFYTPALTSPNGTLTVNTKSAYYVVSGNEVRVVVEANVQCFPGGGSFPDAQLQIPTPFPIAAPGTFLSGIASMRSISHDFTSIILTSQTDMASMSFKWSGVANNEVFLLKFSFTYFK